MVLQAGGAHRLGIEEVAPVHYDRLAWLPRRAPDPARSLPTVAMTAAWAPSGTPDAVGVGHALGGGQQFLRARRRVRIPQAHACPAIEQRPRYRQALRAAHIVGVRLERQSEDGDLLVLQNPQRPLQLLQDAIDAAALMASASFRRLKSGRALANVDERLHILGQAGATVAQPGLQEPGPIR